MKKISLLLLIILIALVGCADSNADEQENYSYNAERKMAQIEKQNIVPLGLNNDLSSGNATYFINDDSGNVSHDINMDLNGIKYMNEDSENLDDPNGLTLNNVLDTTNLLSSYKTQILTNDSNRYNNIKIVSDRLNDYVLAPGETFSFNEVCGPYGQSDGFLEATILLSDGTSSKGFGGGVCQLSSTLYNAVKVIDVDITERHNHSTPVAYVPENEDATVSLQSDLDFKFVNSSDSSIKFKTSCTPDEVTVRVYKNT